MELTIIGSGTGMPSKKRAYPCILLKIKDKHLIFDTGPGSLRQLLFAGVTYLDIDQIYYSHFHPDHSLDLVSVLFTMRYNEPKRISPLCITGPIGLKAFYEALIAAYGETIKPKDFDLELREVEKGVLTYEDWSITTEPIKHSAQSIGFRIESMDGKTITYSGDADYCDGILRLSRKVKILVLECSFPDNQKVEGHLTPRLCAQIANESQCESLILSHFYPVCDPIVTNNKNLLKELKNIYSGEIIFANDFAKFIL